MEEEGPYFGSLQRSVTVTLGPPTWSGDQLLVTVPHGPEPWTPKKDPVSPLSCLKWSPVPTTSNLSTQTQRKDSECYKK